MLVYLGSPKFQILHSNANVVEANNASVANGARNGKVAASERNLSKGLLDGLQRRPLRLCWSRYIHPSRSGITPGPTLHFSTPIHSWTTPYWFDPHRARERNRRREWVSGSQGLVQQIWPHFRVQGMVQGEFRSPVRRLRWCPANVVPL